MINFSGSFQWFQNRFMSYVNRNVNAKMDEAGKAAVRMARSLVPVDTGQTKNSINYIYNRNEMILSIHADTWWAVFVEKGTSKMRARPFLEPSLAAVAKVWGGKYLAVRSVFANAPAKYHRGYQQQSPTRAQFHRGRTTRFSTQVGMGRHI